MMANWIGREGCTGVKVPLRALVLSLALAALFLALSVAHPSAGQATPQSCMPGPHSGTITADEEWCFVHNPHLVNGGVTVDAGATLTVEPGVQILFSPGAGLGVAGTLVAEGTPAEPITLTAPSGTWGGVGAVDGAQVRLAYCDLGYAGSYGEHFGIAVASGADVQVQHCRIHHTSGTGLLLYNDGLMGVFEDLEIDHNSANAVAQNTVNMNPTYSNLRLHDNGLDAVVITGTKLNQDVVLDGSPAALNGAPIHLTGTEVSAGRTLTVTAGTLLKMVEGGGVGVWGTLVAEGTPTHPITLTAQSGNWAGLGAGDGSQLRLAYCDLGYAGSYGEHFGIWVASGADVRIHSCRIHHSSGNGLVVDGVQITVWNVALADNALAGLWLKSGARVDGLHLTLARNGTGAYVASGATAVLTNTILAGNATGMHVVGGGSARLAHTLWDNNTTPSMGVVGETGHIDGPAAFDTDGYHLLPESEALQRGLNVGVAADIDGDPRPMPAGTAPDLGADENPSRRYFYVYLPVVVRQYP